jgi:transcriptional regulator with XRE-family HTH domain
MSDAEAPLDRLGRVIRERRTQAELSLRELAARTNVSNPYLSQLERGLHEPSVRVLTAIAKALNVSAEEMMVQAGMVDANDLGNRPPTVPEAIRADRRLTEEQKAALLSVYRSYVEGEST